MKNDFALAFKQILEDRGLPQEVVLSAIEDAMASAYRHAVHASTAQHVEARINSETGDVQIFAEKEVVEDIQDQRTEVLLETAREVEPETELGDMVIVESTPDDFGRVAAQTARQVIQQRIREAEREIQSDYYSKQAGDIVNGIVQAINARQISIGLDLKAEGIMPRKHQIPREFFRVHDRVRALLVEVQSTNRGPKIILSRAHPDFLRRLLENEVPEIYQGMVEIRSISREPGQRSKVAVAALQPGVDPVGACVGIRGVRIQTIVRELNDEKIDVIEWNPDPQAYIAKALSPARIVGVYLKDEEDAPKTATVVVLEDQLSLAIGREGQNARLTAKLTGWRIDIKSLIEATSELLFKLQNHPDYASFAEKESEAIPTIEMTMTKKAEGRPLTPEEYKEISAFMDRVENGVVEERKEAQREKEARLQAARDAVPAGAYDLPIAALGLSERTNNLLIENFMATAGDLMFKMHWDATAVRAIDGVGPKAMKEIDASIQAMTEAMEAAAKAEAERAARIKAEAEAAVVEAEDETVIAAVEDAPVIEESAAEIETELEGEPEPESEPEPSDEVEQPEEKVEVAPAADTFDPDAELLKEIGELGESADEKRKKFVDVEYDPDQDITIYRKKRKKDRADWENWDGDWKDGDWE
ncbi:MAG: transcription termination factor NusA [Chloroflexota bacterium]